MDPLSCKSHLCCILLSTSQIIILYKSPYLCLSLELPLVFYNISILRNLSLRFDSSFWDVVFLWLALSFDILRWSVFCQLNELAVSFTRCYITLCQIRVFRVIIAFLRSNHWLVVPYWDLLAWLEVLPRIKTIRDVIWPLRFKLNLINFLPCRLSPKNLLVRILSMHFMGCRGSRVAKEWLSLSTVFGEMG